MKQLDPIIAVRDVSKSSKWYQEIFSLRSKHSGNEFDVLINEEDDVLLCLHKWGEHNHPTMQASDKNVGNGLILYFRVENFEEVREKLRSINYSVEEEIALSRNSHRKEFSLRDPDGYYITVADYHVYEG